MEQEKNQYQRQDIRLSLAKAGSERQIKGQPFGCPFYNYLGLN
jgi:hypothetical protein